MKNKEKTFSIKKLVLTILCTVIVSVFIGSTILFIGSLPQWIRAEVIGGMEEGSEFLIEMGKSYQAGYEQIEESFKEDKALYGEDYPSEELFLMQTINIFSTNRIMQVYSISLLAGIVLGTIIYIVAIQNIKGKQIIIELVVAFGIIFAIMMLINLGYETLINKAIQSVNPTDVIYSTYVYNFNSSNILILYIIIAVVIYIGNMVRQRILANKLNKELKKIEKVIIDGR